MKRRTENHQQHTSLNKSLVQAFSNEKGMNKKISNGTIKRKRNYLWFPLFQLM